METVEKNKLSLLWVDLTQVESPYAAAEVFAKVFSVKRLDLAGTPNDTLPGHHDALVFEYDYPDRASLNILRLTKHQFPSMPVIMLTEQHSEALAVWALHSRVWEYLVKPVPEQQVLELHQELAELHCLARREHRQMVHRDESIPGEFRFGEVAETANFLQRAIEYIDAHLSRKLSLQEVSDLCKMSPFRFSRAFKKVYGQTFQDYLTARRIREAVRLLDNPSAPVSDVAYLVGFRDPSHFARTFKKLVGFNPVEYRERLRADSGSAPLQQALFLSTDG